MVGFYVAPVKFLWQVSCFTSGGKPQVHLHALFQIEVGPSEDLPKLAAYLPHREIQTQAGLSLQQ
jgi:hypothetical protein